MRQGSFSWWPVWPAASPSFSASKGLFGSKALVPPGSPSMSQGGPCLGSPGVAPFKAVDALACRASTPARGVFRGALCGPHLPSDGLSGGSGGGASSPRLRMPSFGASRGGDPGSPEPSRGGGGGGCSSPRHTALTAFGSNASGLAVVASTAPLAGSTLAVPSVGAGAAFASDGASPASCASTTACSTAFAPAFPAAWMHPRPAPPGSSGGVWFGGFKASRRGSAARCTEVARSPGAMPRTRVSSDGGRRDEGENEKG